MLVTKSIFALLAGASTVLADGASIVEAINAIQNATLSLGSTVGSWDGSLLGSLPIIVESTSLLTTIYSGAGVAKSSAALSDSEGISVGLAIITLVTDVNTTLATLIAAKPDFDKNFLTGIALFNLYEEKSASTSLSDAIISKLPEDLVSTGETLSDQITASFNGAIEAFGGTV